MCQRLRKGRREDPFLADHPRLDDASLVHIFGRTTLCNINLTIGLLTAVLSSPAESGSGLCVLFPRRAAVTSVDRIIGVAVLSQVFSKRVTTSITRSLPLRHDCTLFDGIIVWVPVLQPSHAWCFAAGSLEQWPRDYFQAGPRRRFKAVAAGLYCAAQIECYKCVVYGGFA
jgi:hypothetical protein